MNLCTRHASGEPSLLLAEGGGGPPLLLLHGVSRMHGDWSAVFDGLEASWRVIAVDQRGHGGSDRADRYLVVDYVVDAVRLVRDEIREPVVILGHSLGAMVAAGVAAALPTLVRGVVLEDPPFHSMGRRIAGSAWQSQFSGMLSAACAGGTAEELAKALADIVLPLSDGGTVRLGAVRDAAALRWTAACLAKLDPEVLTPVIAGHWLDGYDPEGIARQIRCPCVLLQADPTAGGALAEDEARSFVEAAGSCEVERFPGSGHLLHWQHPDRVVAAVERLRQKVAA